MESFSLKPYTYYLWWSFLAGTRTTDKSQPRIFNKYCFFRWNRNQKPTKRRRRNRKPKQGQTRRDGIHKTSIDSRKAQTSETITHSYSNQDLKVINLTSIPSEKIDTFTFMKDLDSFARKLLLKIIYEKLKLIYSFHLLNSHTLPPSYSHMPEIQNNYFTPLTLYSTPNKPLPPPIHSRAVCLLLQGQNRQRLYTPH